ncbi:hypothetical protein ACJ72_05630 [Emergomyces africanus]|uniref:Uncharacterized protein n=1 Tax=Emergomyces africanus TaxID=1955775 RepID=A0A1B7NTD1_9EURO|nr:hypothetical protein ACJ72_05630 [Emergomyces africanus]
MMDTAHPQSKMSRKSLPSRSQNNCHPYPHHNLASLIHPSLNVSVPAHLNMPAARKTAGIMLRPLERKSMG